MLESLHCCEILVLFQKISFIKQPILLKIFSPVAHANKTTSLLHAHASGDLKSITSSELKKLGRPYAALLRA